MRLTSITSRPRAARGTGSVRIAQQSGFTLVEILVALALITLLAVGITLAFDGSRSRAQALFSNMSELGAGNIRLKNDMGCYVSAPTGLTKPQDAGTNNYCGINTTTTWNGPYVGPFQIAADGTSVEIDKIAQGVTLSFIKDGTCAASATNNPYGANGTNYCVFAQNVPQDVVKQALQECTGQQQATGLVGQKCDGDITNGTFTVLYDQTR
jgi:prepilin-type N-terminal cleavage/methylation domain-containing protein